MKTKKMFNWLLVKFHKTFGLSEELRKKKVEVAKQIYLDSLREVENNPANQAVLNNSLKLGYQYEGLARELEVNIESSNDGFDRKKEIYVAQYKGLNKSELEISADEIENNFDEIMVVINGNWGDIAMTLSEWIRKGPGNRFLRQPIRAWNLKTGREMSLDEIPLQYRNNEESRKKIENGEISDPWDFETSH
jgi:hypothetical protein